MLEGFCGKDGIPITLTRRVFQTVVVGTALSGMEAETPHGMGSHTHGPCHSGPGAQSSGS